MNKDEDLDRRQENQLLNEWFNTKNYQNMSQDTRLFCEVKFHNKTYNTKQEVANALECANSTIDNIERDLENLAFMTEPKKFCDNTETPESYIKNRLEILLNDLQESITTAFKLELLLSNWDKCHNEEGKAVTAHYKILNVKDTEKIWSGDIAFLDGDFVKTDEKDKENE